MGRRPTAILHHRRGPAGSAITVPILGIGLEKRGGYCSAPSSAWRPATGRSITVQRAREFITATGQQLDETIFKRFTARLSYVSGDFADPGTYKRVGETIKDASRPVFYLEIPPFLFATTVKGLSEADLIRSGRVVVEKPFLAMISLQHAHSRPTCINTWTNRSCSGSITTSERWASRRSSICDSPRRCSSGLELELRQLRRHQRRPRASESRIAATSTTRLAPFVTSS